jgi:hypothetical protein
MPDGRFLRVIADFDPNTAHLSAFESLPRDSDLSVTSNTGARDSNAPLGACSAYGHWTTRASIISGGDGVADQPVSPL